MNKEDAIIRADKALETAESKKKPMAPNSYASMYDNSKKALLDKVISVAGKVSTDHWINHF